MPYKEKTLATELALPGTEGQKGKSKKDTQEFEYIREVG